LNSFNSFIFLFEFGILVSSPVPVPRFSCGFDGHLCTFPCGDDF
jgi:hypothetical protein